MLEQGVKNGQRAETPQLSSSPDNSDLNIVYIYLSYVRSFPVLSAGQEDFLFRSRQQGKDLDFAREGLTSLRVDGEDFSEALANSRHIRDLIINCNLRMVIPLARKYTGLTLMDRVQEGNIGLIRAVDAFNPDTGSRFYNFAFNHVRGEIVKAKYGDKIVTFPERVSEAVDLAWGIFDTFYQREQHPPTMGEWIELLHQRSELSKNQAADTLNSILLGRAKPVSIDTPLVKGAKRDFTIADIASDPNSDFTDGVNSRIDAKDAAPQIFSLLTQQEQQIIALRFGFTEEVDEYTADDVAKKINRTRRRVLQIQRNAFDKVRADKILSKYA